jgi:hypothetical protein
MLAVVAYVYNTSSLEVEAGGSQIHVQPWATLQGPVLNKQRNKETKSSLGLEVWLKGYCACLVSTKP